MRLTRLRKTGNTGALLDGSGAAPGIAWSNSCDCAAAAAARTGTSSGTDAGLAA